MMCYEAFSGAFDFTKKEYELLFNLCDDRIVDDYENNMRDVYFDPHKYLQYRQLRSKLEGILELMESKTQGKPLDL